MEVHTAVKTLTDHFIANYLATPVEFDNGPVQPLDEPHVKFTVQVGNSQPNLDSKYKRTVGVVIVRVMVPKGAGDLIGWQIANSVRAALELRTVGGVSLTSADYINAGLLGDQLEQDAGWYQINVNVPFWFDHVVM